MTNLAAQLCRVVPRDFDAIDRNEQHRAFFRRLREMEPLVLQHALWKVENKRMRQLQDRSREQTARRRHKREHAVRIATSDSVTYR